MPAARRWFLLRVLDAPEKVRLLLEDEAVGPAWLDTVGELSAVHGPGDGKDLPPALVAKILQVGFSGLEEAEFRSLVTSPRSLIPLQKAIQLDGGAHWDAVVERADRPVDSRERLPNPRLRWLLWAACAAAVALAFSAGWWLRGERLPPPPVERFIAPHEFYGDEMP